MTARGYACRVDGEIQMRTVSETTTGAKVNGLMVLFNVPALADWSDERVAEVWGECLARLAEEKPGQHRVAVVPVEVRQTI